MARAAPWWWSLCGAQRSRYSRRRKAAGLGERSGHSEAWGFPYIQFITVTPTAAQTPEAKSAAWGRGNTGDPDPTLPKSALVPRAPPRPAHLTEGGTAEGCGLDQNAVFVHMYQVLAENPAPGRVDDGHAVLE